MKKMLLIVCMFFVVPVVIYSFLQGRQPVVNDVAIAASGMPKLIKFSAPMCSDCQVLAETLRQVEPQYKGKVDFVEIAVNQNSVSVRDMIKRFDVKLVPTMVFLNSRGEQFARIEGAISKEELVKYLNQGLE